MPPTQLGVSVNGSVLATGTPVSSVSPVIIHVADPNDLGRVFAIRAAADQGKTTGMVVTVPEATKPTTQPAPPGYQVTEGWALFAGVRPLGRGKRVRVHGSGTAFVIQCIAGPPTVERVILIKGFNTSAKVTLDTNPNQPPVTLNGGGHSFVEVIPGVGTATDTLSAPAPVPASGPVQQLLLQALNALAGMPPH